MNINEHKFLIGSAMILLAAVVMSGALVWYGISARGGGLAAQSLPAGAPSLASTLPAGAPNPADILPQYSNTLTPVVGEITAVDSGGITVAGTRVVVDNNTEIYTTGAIKDPKAYQQERDAFVKNMQYSANTKSVIFVGPDSFVHAARSLADLKVGMPVSISPKKAVSDGVLALSIFIMR